MIDIFLLDTHALRAKYPHFNPQGWLYNTPIPSDVLSVEVIMADDFDARLAFPMGSQYLQGSHSKFWWRPLARPGFLRIPDTPPHWRFNLAQDIPDYVRYVRVVHADEWREDLVRTKHRSELVYNMPYFWKHAARGDGYGLSPR